MEKNNFVWHPIHTREMTKEEHKIFDGQTDRDWVYDCELPKYGEQVLVTNKYGDVFTVWFGLYGVDDIFDDDDGPYFDRYYIVAWMPCPKPYNAVLRMAIH